MKHFILTKFWVPVFMALWALIGWSSMAHALSPAKDRVVLTVSGKIATKNQGQQAVFDMAMLEALPQRSFTTMTPWENQPIKFSGPLLRDVLAAVKADGKNIKATAINDYRINIPIEDSQLFDMVVATRMNDAPMPVRAKGPLFIVYPFDSKLELKSNKYYERSIWQLKAIEVE